MKFTQVHPLGEVGRPVNFVAELESEGRDAVDNPYGVDPISVISNAGVTGDVKKVGETHFDTSFFEELSDYGFRGRLAKVNATPGEPPQGLTLMGLGCSNEQHPVVVDADPVGPGGGSLLSHEVVWVAG